MVMLPIYLILGAPAVGKSTTSRMLASEFPKSLHIPVDDLRMMVVSGLMQPSAEWPPELAEQVRLARLTAVEMALRYQKAGFAVVIDDFWDEGCRSDYQPLFLLPFVHRIVLYPSREEAHRRNLMRAGDDPSRAYIDEGIRVVYDTLDRNADRLQGEGWRLIDTTTMDAGDVVLKMISGV